MCGITGVYNVPKAGELMKRMLHALQNRGTDAVGIDTFDNKEHNSFKAAKTVSDGVTDDVLMNLTGNCGVGHVRYATAADSSAAVNFQPLSLQVGTDVFAIVHNGNFTNCEELENTVLKGTPFFSQSDTERFFQLILQHYADHELFASIEYALDHMKGSCSSVLARSHELIAIRDTSGNRPLYWGTYDEGYVVASETCALDDIGVFQYHEIPPGTIMSFSPAGIRTHSLPMTERHLCSFEWVYFGYPTSTISGVQVAAFRRDLGRALWQEQGLQTDVVVAVPDSSTLIGDGYIQNNKASVLDRSIIMRKHNTGRTFIIPGQGARRKAVADKFSFRTDLIANKRITVIDDSLVRGTTAHGISSSLRERGAREVHWRFASPRIIAPCHYGINTPNQASLLAANLTNADIATKIGADSVAFLSMERFAAVIQKHAIAPEDCCFACMNNNYWH